MVEVLVVELGFPFQGLGLAEWRPEGQAAAAVVVVPLLPELGDGRVLLARVLRNSCKVKAPGSSSSLWVYPRSRRIVVPPEKRYPKVPKARRRTCSL